MKRLSARITTTIQCWNNSVLRVAKSLSTPLFFQAEDGIRDKGMWLDFRRVLFRSLRAVAKIDLESERSNAAAVRSLAMKDIYSADSRAAHDRSGRDSNRHHVERVLQRDAPGRAERASITKRRDKELSIFCFIVMKSTEDRGCFRREAGPEAELVVTTFQQIRIIVT